MIQTIPSKFDERLFSHKIIEKKRSLCWFLIDFVFCKLAETAVSGFPSVT